ncbi:MAG TPA: DUF222 domain-containing protein [Galbitalea sp.]|jgi:hypothetical protein
MTVSTNESVESGSNTLDAVVRLLGKVDIEAMGQFADNELCAQLAIAEIAARRLSAIQVTGASIIAERSRRELGTAGLAQRNGCVRPSTYLERLLRISGSEANRRIHLGSALRTGVGLTGEPIAPRFPALARELPRGEIEPEAVAIIVRALDDVRRVAHPDDLDVAEKGLVEHARHHSVQQVADLAVAVRDRLDPDGVLPREEETRLRRGFSLGRERNGIVPVRGALTPTTAALLQSAFDEANAPGAQPRFLSDEDQREGTETIVNEDGSESLTVRDTRSRDQRQHDVLDGLLTAGVRNTGRETGQLRSTAEVTAHVSVADLEAGIGVGHIDGIREPVSMNTIKQLLCDAVFRKAVLGNDGEIIAFGKARYPFSSAQRRAIIARDGDTCLLCEAPVAWADAHHVREYYTNGGVGETNVDNGVLLCSRHHHLIHHSNWQLRMVDGIPHVLAPPEIDPCREWKRLGRRRVQVRRAA